MRLRLWICVTVLCAVTGTAQATPITFTLTSSLLTAVPGSTVTFSGSLTETGGTITFLNGDNFTSALPADDSPFFSNFPVSLAAFQTFSAPMFRVTVPLLTAPGLYSGGFTILGGSTPSALTTLASQPFAVSVTPVATAVPEPASLLLLSSGGAALLARRRRRDGV